MNPVKGLIEKFWGEEVDAEANAAMSEGFPARLEGLINDIMVSSSEKPKTPARNIRVEILTLIFGDKKYAEVIEKHKAPSAALIKAHEPYFDEIFNALGVEDFLIWIEKTSIPPLNKSSVMQTYISWWIHELRTILAVDSRQDELVSRTEQLLMVGKEGVTPLDRVRRSFATEERSIDGFWNLLIKPAQELSFRGEILGLTKYFFQMLVHKECLIDNFNLLSKEDDDEEDFLKTMITQPFVEEGATTTLLDSIILPVLSKYTPTSQEQRKRWHQATNWIANNVNAPESYEVVKGKSSKLLSDAIGYTLLGDGHNRNAQRDAGKVCAESIEPITSTPSA
jgi:hypothetical protein